MNAAIGSVTHNGGGSNSPCHRLANAAISGSPAVLNTLPLTNPRTLASIEPKTRQEINQLYVSIR